MNDTRPRVGSAAASRRSPRQRGAAGGRPTRWNLWLPAASLGLAAAFVLLAATAAGALRDRHELAIQGRLFLLAHRLEIRLREEGPGEAQATLAHELENEGGFVRGLALLDADGRPEIETGTIAEGGAREVELFLGPAWRTAGGGGGFGPPWRRTPGAAGRGGGHRTLAIALEPAAVRPPVIARLLVPSSAAGGLVLVALAVLGGRLLVRRQAEARREEDRKRLEGLARAGAGLAHQLRTPLATIKGSSQLLLESAPPEARRRLAAIQEQAGRMDRLLAQLLDYARPPHPEPEAVEVAEAVAEIGPLDGEIPAAIPAGLCAWVDREHLREILGNLVANARQASPTDRPVEVAAETRGGEVEIRVADRGPGPSEDPEQLFEPYVTSRADGTGLGLPIARSLAHANGGRLALVPRPGGGTVARLTLPAPRGTR